MRPCTPSVHQLDPTVEIWGGYGVGKVTKPGLAPEVGGPAINPVPRRMITQAVGEMKARYGVKEVYINYIGPVIGSHTGPNTMGIFFVGTKR